MHDATSDGGIHSLHISRLSGTFLSKQHQLIKYTIFQSTEFFSFFNPNVRMSRTYLHPESCFGL